MSHHDGSRLDIYVHLIVNDSAVTAKLDNILQTLVVLGKEVKQVMATLDEVLVDVQAETTLIDGVSTLIAGLKQQLADALSGVLNADQQAKVDAIFAAAEANKQKLTDALAANVPPAPA